jgi:hypothetical protein
VTKSIPLRIVGAPEGFWGHYLNEEEKLKYKPGDMWRAVHEDPMGEPEMTSAWAIVLPNMTVWYTTQKATDGTRWDVTGAPPNITVNPSINDANPENGWHGHIKEGVITTV